MFLKSMERENDQWVGPFKLEGKKIRNTQQTVNLGSGKWGLVSLSVVSFLSIVGLWVVSLCVFSLIFQPNYKL